MDNHIETQNLNKMRTIKIITLLLIISTSFVQAQNKVSSKDQTRTIEINNENGDLYISFKNGTITEFTVNDSAVPKESYNDYQSIIDEFSDEEVQPTPPTPPETNTDETAQLYQAMTTYLTSKDLINEEKKFRIQLKNKYLKVNGKELAHADHLACLDIFDEIYGHRLNDKSEVKFRKSRKNYKSSIKIHQ